MNRILIGALLIASLLPLTLLSQQKKGFEINGHIDGLQDKEKVLLAHFPDPNKAATRDDSCFVTNGGDIHLKGIAPEEGPHFYLISFDNGGVRHRIQDEKLGENVGGSAINLFIANGDKIMIHGSNINKIKQNYFQ